MKSTKIDSLGNRRRATYRNGTISVYLLNNKWTLQWVKFLVDIGFTNVDRVARGIGMRDARFVFAKVILANLDVTSGV